MRHHCEPLIRMLKIAPRTRTFASLLCAFGLVAAAQEKQQEKSSPLLRLDRFALLIERAKQIQYTAFTMP